MTLGNGITGGTVGLGFNNQLPGLATRASYVVRWKADNSFNSLATWNPGTSQWDDTPGWLGTGGSLVAEHNGNQAVELRIPRASLGLFGPLVAHVNWVYEGAGFESTYAGSPADSFVDGFDPDYGRLLQLDLQSAESPLAQQ